MNDFLDFLAHHKKIWIGVIVVFFAVLVVVAWKLGQTPDSPYEYRLD